MLFLESNVIMRKPIWRKLGHKITLLLTNDLRHVLVKFARSKESTLLRLVCVHFITFKKHFLTNSNKSLLIVALLHNIIMSYWHLLAFEM